MKALAILERNKGIVLHRGVLLDDGRVFHNTPEKGEHISSFSEYAQGKQVTRKPIPTHFQYASAKRILNSLIQPNRYSLLGNNCQHSANRVVFGSQKSEYVTAGLVILTAIGLYAALRKKL